MKQQKNKWKMPWSSTKIDKEKALGGCLTYVTAATAGLAVAALPWLSDYTSCKQKAKQVEHVEQRKAFIPVSSEYNRIEGLYMNEEDVETVQDMYGQKASVDSQRDSLISRLQQDREEIRDSINAVDEDVREVYKKVMNIEGLSSQSYSALNIPSYKHVFNHNTEEEDEAMQKLKERGLFNEGDTVQDAASRTDTRSTLRRLGQLHRDLYNSSVLEEQVNQVADSYKNQLEDRITSEEPGFFQSRFFDTPPVVKQLSFLTSDYQGEGIPEDATHCSIGPVTIDDYAKVSQAIQESDSGEEYKESGPVLDISQGAVTLTDEEGIVTYRP